MDPPTTDNHIGVLWQRQLTTFIQRVTTSPSRSAPRSTKRNTPTAANVAAYLLHIAQAYATWKRCLRAVTEHTSVSWHALCLCSMSVGSLLSDIHMPAVEVRQHLSDKDFQDIMAALGPSSHTWLVHTTANSGGTATHPSLADCVFPGAVVVLWSVSPHTWLCQRRHLGHAWMESSTTTKHSAMKALATAQRLDVTMKVATVPFPWPSQDCDQCTRLRAAMAAQEGFVQCLEDNLAVVPTLSQRNLQTCVEIGSLIKACDVLVKQRYRSGAFEYLGHVIAFCFAKATHNKTAMKRHQASVMKVLSIMQRLCDVTAVKRRFQQQDCMRVRGSGIKRKHKEFVDDTDLGPGPGSGSANTQGASQFNLDAMLRRGQEAWLHSVGGAAIKLPDVRPCRKELERLFPSFALRGVGLWCSAPAADHPSASEFPYTTWEEFHKAYDDSRKRPYLAHLRRSGSPLKPTSGTPEQELNVLVKCLAYVAMMLRMAEPSDDEVQAAARSLNLASSTFTLTPTQERWTMVICHLVHPRVFGEPWGAIIVGRWMKLLTTSITETASYAPVKASRALHTVLEFLVQTHRDLVAPAAQERIYALLLDMKPRRCQLETFVTREKRFRRLVNRTAPLPPARTWATMRANLAKRRCLPVDIFAMVSRVNPKVRGMDARWTAQAQLLLHMATATPVDRVQVLGLLSRSSGLIPLSRGRWKHRAVQEGNKAAASQGPLPRTLPKRTCGLIAAVYEAGCDEEASLFAPFPGASDEHTLTHVRTLFRALVASRSLLPAAKRKTLDVWRAQWGEGLSPRDMRIWWSCEAVGMTKSPTPAFTPHYVWATATALRHTTSIAVGDAYVPDPVLQRRLHGTKSVRRWRLNMERLCAGETPYMAEEPLTAALQVMEDYYVGLETRGEGTATSAHTTLFSPSATSTITPSPSPSPSPPPLAPPSSASTATVERVHVMVVDRQGVPMQLIHASTKTVYDAPVAQRGDTHIRCCTATHPPLHDIVWQKTRIRHKVIQSREAGWFGLVDLDMQCMRMCATDATRVMVAYRKEYGMELYAHCQQQHV